MLWQSNDVMLVYNLKGVTFYPNTPKYTQIHHKMVFIVLVKGSIWIIFHKKIQIS